MGTGLLRQILIPSFGHARHSANPLVLLNYPPGIPTLTITL